MGETTIEYHLRDQIKAIGGKAYKFISPGNRGVPDRLVCLPKGKIIFVELKDKGKKPTSKQLNKHAELIRLGYTVFVADCKAEVDKIIDYCKTVIS